MKMKRDRVIRIAVIAIPVLILSLFLLYPVVNVIFRGIIFGPGSDLVETIYSPLTQRVFSFTIIQAILSTVVSSVIGIPGAIILAKVDFRGRNLLRTFLIVPFVLPPIVVVVGFLQVFGQGGAIDILLQMILGADESLFNVATGWPGIILAHAFYNIPLFLILISASIEHLNPEIEEIAETLGASRLQVIKKIIIPHIRTSTVVASILTFLFCFMSFPIVLALGQGTFMTVEVQIWNAFRFFNYGEASTLALLQMIITSTIAIFYVLYGTRREEASKKRAFQRLYSLDSLDNKTRIAIGIYLIALLVFLSGPILAIIRAAIYDPITKEYTLSGFAYLIEPGLSGGLFPLINSVYYASLATLFSVVLGIPLAYSQKNQSNRIQSISSFLILLPLGISSITVAYGLMLSIAVPLGISASPWPLIVIAQTIIGIPFTARSIEASLRKIDQEILDQADSLGASRLQKLFFVELPLLAPGIAAGAVFSFAMAIGEMSATLFLARPENFTLAVIIYRELVVRRFVQAGAAALLLVAVCVIAFAVIEKLTDEGYGGAF